MHVHLPEEHLDTIERNNAMKKLLRSALPLVFLSLLMFCSACASREVPSKDQAPAPEITISDPDLRKALAIYDDNILFLEKNADYLSNNCRKIIASELFFLCTKQEIENGRITSISEVTDSHETYSRELIAVETGDENTLFFEMGDTRSETSWLTAIWVNDYHNTEDLVYAAFEDR